MQKIGLFEAKNRLSELVERAAQGEKIGITRRGKLAALIVPVRPKLSLKEIFDEIEGIRKRAKLPAGITVMDLIEEGRV
ncbi:MAG: type II toxin-antitoxin system prevent-host-death family antitoxin [Acidobacteria bacterium]|nr:type II toxin-antitoxin system prevent-host-death family antitoxin [Acidobacteriota bacterium]